MRGSITHTARTYNKVSIWIIAGLSLMILFISQILSTTHPILDIVLMPVLVSVIFSLVASIAFSGAWKSVATSAPENQSKFFLAASVVRMIAALVVVLAGALLLRPDKTAIIAYIAVFVVYYVSLLIFESIYFARIVKK